MKQLLFCKVCGWVSELIGIGMKNECPCCKSPLYIKMVNPRMMQNPQDDTKELERIKREHAELLEVLECLVIMFGKQDYDCSLLPLNEQTEEVSDAITLIKRVKENNL